VKYANKLELCQLRENIEWMKCDPLSVFHFYIYSVFSFHFNQNLMHCLLWNSVKRYVGSEREKDLLHKISAHALHDKLMISNGHSFFMYKIDLALSLSLSLSHSSSMFNVLCIVGLHMSFVTWIWILITQRNRVENVYKHFSKFQYKTI
jgi:hypothetical protein